MYILIVGGGKVGTNLSAALMKMGHEVSLIERDRHLVVCIVDQGKQRHRSRLNSEQLHQGIRRAKRQPASGGNLACQRLQLNRGALIRHKQEVILLAVAQEQILGVNSRDVAAKLP